MSFDSVEISNLAHVLHENGDKILNGYSKLSVNAALLQQISVELGSIATEGRIDGNVSFEVLSPQHGPSRTVEHLQFLHDFFQKTMGLKLDNSANMLLSGTKIDLSKFKKLKYLELRRVPVKQLVGLKVVQHQMECIVCERGLTALEHLLAECGGDNSTGFVWSELKEAVLSFNEIRIVDSSVAFAPRLQVLDLSHNQIFDVNAIERLPNLKYVNLSYNTLESIPVFNKSARKRMEVLVLKNNYIEDLKPLFGLDALTELDVSNNLICCSHSFEPLLSISTLQWLSLKGNPVSLTPGYRVSVIKHLHISAAFGNFVLDGGSLSKKERELVGMELMSKSQMTASTPLLAPGAEAGPSTTEPPVAESTAEKPKRKSGKMRIAVIPNLDGTYEDLPPEVKDISLSVPSSEHLVTKALIANARVKYGDDWLRCEAAEAVQDALGLPRAPLSSTPFDDSCLTAILKDVTLKEVPVKPALADYVVTTRAVIEHIPEETQESNEADSFLSCNDENRTAYFSLDGSSAITVEPKETSPDIETIEDSEDEREEGGQERLYLVVRLIREGSQCRREELFLSLTGTELRERETTHGRTVGSWSLASLESVTRTRPDQVHLVFDTIRRDRQERVYELEPLETAELYEACRAELEDRSLSEMRQTPYRCVSCSTAFSFEKKKRINDAGPVCPVCGSKVVLLADDEATTPGFNQEKTQPAPKPKTSHNRSASVGVFNRADAEMRQEILKCSSHSSIEEITDSPSADLSKESSAASLDDHNPPPLPVVMTVAGKRCDSDIEIISNPSQSSIEVIDAPSRLQAEAVVGEEKLTSPALGNVAAFAGLTESSSSGSVTDSICTAYENSGSMVSSGVSKKSGLESSTLLEEPSEIEEYSKQSIAVNDFQHLLKGVLDRVGEKVGKSVRVGVDKDIDLVEYSFTKFDELDHRIKLYVYAHLFEDNAEECVFLLRCQILFDGEEKCYDACVVCSDIKLYVLKVTGKEEGEEASKFLQKVENLSFKLSSLKSWRALPWNLGFSVTHCTANGKTLEFLIFLKEMTKTLNFKSFMSSSDRLLPKSCELNDTPEPGSILRVTEFLVSTADDSALLAVAGLDACEVDEEGSATHARHADGAVFLTATDLFIVSSLKWFFSASQDSFPTPVGSHKISDLMQAIVRERELRLEFLREAEGRQESWVLTFASEAAVRLILDAVKAPWEHLFSVPLQVTEDDNF